MSRPKKKATAKSKAAFRDLNAWKNPQGGILVENITPSTSATDSKRSP